MTLRADRTCEKRMAEMAERALREGTACFSDFLTPAERLTAEICARQAGAHFAENGGLPDAERRVVAFCAGEALAWPIGCLQVSWRQKFAALSHRDLLGAILALGLKREKIGDIVVGEGEAHVMARAEIAPFLAGGLVRAANVTVSARAVPLPQDPLAAAGGGTEKRATVASLRLDALIAEAFGLSRGSASALVTSGCVSVDFRKALHPDEKLPEGAMISVRGMGRAELRQARATKKNRVGVTFFVY